MHVYSFEYQHHAAKHSRQGSRQVGMQVWIPLMSDDFGKAVYKVLIRQNSLMLSQHLASCVHAYAVVSSLISNLLMKR